MPSKKKDEPGFSRRTFLKTVGAGGVAAGVLGPAPGGRRAGRRTPSGPARCRSSSTSTDACTGSRSSRA